MSKLDKIEQAYEEIKDVTPMEADDTGMNMPEEPQEETEAERQIDKGIVIYHDELGNINYQYLGTEITLENVIFYKEYMQRIADAEWESANALKQQTGDDVNA